MNKTTLLKEVKRELKKLNNTIDSKIVHGCSYRKEARRHKDLLSTLRRIDEEKIALTRRRSRLGKSPVRRSLEQKSSSRLFSWNFV